jgi:hypothetical protein
MGILTKGMGVIMKRFSKPKKVTKSTVDLSDDGGPYVRKQKFNAKKAKEKGAITNKSGHVVGTPNKERSAESIKKYQGIK